MFGFGKKRWKSEGWMIDSADCIERASQLSKQLRSDGFDEIAMLVDIVAPSWAEPFYRAIETAGGPLLAQFKDVEKQDGPNNAGIVAFIAFALDQGPDVAAGVLEGIIQAHDDPQAAQDLALVGIVKDIISAKEAR